MTRVSLKEAYDNKDVVAQIYAIRDIAEGAEDTANNAVSTANSASEHVNALVPQVESAVQNANNASASAQTSAQTVTGYENRISALETADGQNVKLSGAQNITGIKTVPTEATGSRSQQIANSAKVGAELDNYAPMVRTTGNQEITGDKTLSTIITKDIRYGKAIGYSNNTMYKEVYKWPRTLTGAMVHFSVLWGFNTNARYGVADCLVSTSGICRVSYKGTSQFSPENVYLCDDGVYMSVVIKSPGYNGFNCILIDTFSYGQNIGISNDLEVSNVILSGEPTVGDVYTSVTKGVAF